MSFWDDAMLSLPSSRFSPSPSPSALALNSKSWLGTMVAQHMSRTIVVKPLQSDGEIHFRFLQLQTGIGPESTTSMNNPVLTHPTLSHDLRFAAHQGTFEDSKFGGTENLSLQLPWLKGVNSDTFCTCSNSHLSPLVAVAKAQSLIIPSLETLLHFDFFHSLQFTSLAACCRSQDTVPYHSLLSK
ncbi:F-box protein [Corchorus olitorius]|uniref:F-box protein n=1 Tax=Corchorus olitorius TaxID=93759 RepID=A0A1R3H9S3_9ROSI|nr:F-box protein [Corchorus olitorius]